MSRLIIFYDKNIILVKVRDGGYFRYKNLRLNEKLTLLKSVGILLIEDLAGPRGFFEFVKSRWLVKKTFICYRFRKSKVLHSNLLSPHHVINVLLMHPTVIYFYFFIQLC